VMAPAAFQRAHLLSKAYAPNFLLTRGLIATFVRCQCAEL
jgi:hypothetical protein